MAEITPEDIEEAVEEQAQQEEGDTILPEPPAEKELDFDTED